MYFFFFILETNSCFFCGAGGIILVQEAQVSQWANGGVERLLLPPQVHASALFSPPRVEWMDE